jgi:hypothetical protein
MGIIIGWLIGILLIVGFQFFWWRRLKADYDEMEVTGIGWLIAIVYGVGGVLGVLGDRANVGNVLGWWSPYLFQPVWGLVLAQIVIVWIAWIRDWKIWSMAQDVMIGLYAITGLIQLVQVIFGKDNIYDLLITIICFVIYRYLSLNYRRWAWYASGKKGFVFFAVNAIYFMSLGVSWILVGGGVGEMIKIGLLPIMSLIMMIGLVMLGRQ